ncbi:DUF3611 family protein [Thiocystis violascens]|uniref:DUF3611 family protein n=1 Tax=Thiocystis violascens (strain ATCC 17096 / DSM 198 / 6111) TaxID=765911 RepID=I3Y8V0_THIV6|nr:DUF3611 family protein [Thiocystis violascens]AFL73418.1 Protein of unknown function (DUF3611) [Thiocystis violascens DSM 198]
MLKELIDSLQSTNRESLGNAFSRLGWSGFWIQIVVGAIPIILMVYFFTFANSPTGPRAGLPMVEFLTLGSLVLLVFTTFWFWRYTRIAKSIRAPQSTLPLDSLNQTVWTGIVASSIGILLSVTVVFVEASHLLFYFLSSPQAGVPVIQAQTAGTSWVSAVDMISLMALILVLAAEVAVLVLGLWLLFRTTQSCQAAA